MNSRLPIHVLVISVFVSTVFSVGQVSAQQTVETLGPDSQRRGVVSDLPLIERPKVAWSYKNEHERNGEMKAVGLSSPCVVDQVVYIGDDNGVLRSFNSINGELNWEYDHSERIYSIPVCDGRHVYITSEIGLDVIDCKSGERVWHKLLDENEGVGRCVAWPPRAPEEGKLTTVFYSTDEGEIRAVDTTRGLAKWRSSLMENLLPDPDGFDGDRARMAERNCRPTGISTNGDFVIQSMFDQCRIVAFGNRSGQEIWSFPTEGWTYGAAAIDGNDVFIASQKRKLFCVSLEDGTENWSFSCNSRIESTPSVYGNKVYIPSCDGKLWCLDRETGKEVWHYDAGRTAIYCQPLVTESAVYFATGNGFVHAVDPSNGKQIWKLRAMENGDLYSEIATDGNRLFVKTRQQLNDGKWSGVAALVAIGNSETAEQVEESSKEQ